MLLPHLTLTAAVILSSIAVFAYIHLYWRFIRQKRCLANLNRELDIALQCLNNTEVSTNSKSFDANLDEAQKNARLEHFTPSGHFNLDKTNLSVPEKYRHLKTLVSHGMDSDQIADILKVSPKESEQLIKLFNFANQYSM